MPGIKPGMTGDYSFLPLPRLPAATHTGAAKRRAQAAGGLIFLPCRARGAPRLLLLPCRACGAPRLLACARPVRRDFVMERNAHFVERGLVDFTATPLPPVAALRAASGELLLIPTFSPPAGRRCRQKFRGRIVDHRELG